MIYLFGNLFFQLEKLFNKFENYLASEINKILENFE